LRACCLCWATAAHASRVYAPTTDSAWQHVRALPCTAGCAVFFSHRLIHWGSQGRPGTYEAASTPVSHMQRSHNTARGFQIKSSACQNVKCLSDIDMPSCHCHVKMSMPMPGSNKGPRVSISFAASDHSFKVAEPYFDPVVNLPLPPFELRVSLAAAQMLCYAGNGRFSLVSLSISLHIGIIRLILSSQRQRSFLMLSTCERYSSVSGFETARHNH
jgi:hypothetical protein